MAADAFEDDDRRREMAIGEAAGKAKEALRKAVVPGAASVVGAGAGLFLTRKNRSITSALPDLKDLGIGNLADDLRGKVENVVGKTNSSGSRQSAPGRRTFDASDLAARRQEREERRNRRRSRA